MSKKYGYIEFDYETEDGNELVIIASATITHQSNYAADMENHKGYPARIVSNIKFQAYEESEKFDKSKLSEEDLVGIEDFVCDNIREEYEWESDFYDRSEK